MTCPFLFPITKYPFQTALERLLDRLLEEYIEEIEKMAEIVAQDEYMEEEVGPLEFRMTGNSTSPLTTRSSPRSHQPV